MAHALANLEGVAEARADYPQRRATVVFDKALVGLEDLRRALLLKGFVVVSTGGDPVDTGKPFVSPPAGIAKPPQKDDLVCYCFEYTRGDIEDDFLENGRSLILERIAAEKKRGACQCAARNPKGG